ncbi:MAG: hypothetical protein OEV91_05565 [Desulfobulbaceae bacterium]|nr:hypothetical protein [Desulfobulbaceae bacterium]
MGEAEDLLPTGERIRKAVRWLCETLQSDPDKDRLQVLREAEIRFDLSPAECLFLDSKLGQCGPDGGNGGD